MLSFRCSLARKRKFEEEEDDNEVSTELSLSYKIHKPYKNGSIDTAATTCLFSEGDAVLRPLATRNLLDGICLYSEIKKEPQEDEGEGEGSEISTELTLSCFNPNKIISKMVSDDHEDKAMVRVWNESCVLDVKPIRVFVPPTDVWKIKKRLTASDLGHMSRLMLTTKAVNEHILTFWGKEEIEKVSKGEGITVRVLDCDDKERTEHELVFKRWTSSKGYVFVTGWTPKFVNRRGLNVDDLVGLFWDVSNSRFNFSLLQRAPIKN
ncbi:AP2/B3-like transcriptional factor family protein [Euphorbia peplus]|nr:AP2/B3-like transcriptional factor family protein [Euphorbia peplus]